MWYGWVWYGWVCYGSLYMLSKMYSLPAGELCFCVPYVWGGVKYCKYSKQ